jgi:hypothetical protein
MVATQTLTEAEAQYLVEIWNDCEAWLGPDTELLDLRREELEDGIRLIAAYRLGEHQHESAGVGATILAAHVVLRDRILVDRLRFGFTDLVDQA